MLQWFIGAFDDTADSAVLVQAPVGNENVIKPRGTRTNIGTKSFGVACKHLVGSAFHLPRSLPGAAQREQLLSCGIHELESEKVTPPFL